MSCTSPRTVASTISALPAESVFSMCGSRWATAAFIVSADCRTNGSCILPLPNSSPTVFIPASRSSLTIASGVRPCASASSRSSGSPIRAPSTMRCCSRSASGSAARALARSALVSASETPSNRSR